MKKAAGSGVKNAFAAVHAAAAAEHHARVDAVVAQVKARPDGVPMSIRKPSGSHQIHRRDWKKNCHRIDVGALNNVLEIVPFGRDRIGERCAVAICEGQVEMGQLARAALAHGLVPQVVPEFNNFTVAGLINGEGIQTSGFKFGVFSHSVIWAEVVLGNGDRVVASMDENFDLFEALPESMGTMGIVVTAAIALRPAKPFVRSTYRVFDDLDGFFDHYNRKVLRGDETVGPGLPRLP